MVKRFKKKPVVIEAIQWNGDFEELKGFCPIVIDLGCDCSTEKITSWPIHIPTLEGMHLANIGDWIIKGIKGEFYPCKPDIFAATYVWVMNENV